MKAVTEYHFFAELVAHSEINVDALTFASLIGIIALTMFCGYQLLVRPDLFSGSTYAFGCASLLGAMGAGKGMRDGLTPKPKEMNDGQPSEPDRAQSGQPSR